MEDIFKLESDMNEPDISKRMSFDMRPVLKNPEKAESNYPLYTVYRNLYIIGGKIRYDVTLIPSSEIGGEFAKTFGHYHMEKFPEIYEVLTGHAYFLMQRRGKDPGEITEVYAVEALAGEKAVMLPEFGHLSINVGKEPLIMANWIGLVEYDYETIKKYKGGCYYILNSEQNIEFEENQNYKSVPEIVKLRPKENIPELGVEKNVPIAELQKTPEKLDWLINPEKYQELLTIKNLYREI